MSGGGVVVLGGLLVVFVEVCGALATGVVVVVLWLVVRVEMCGALAARMVIMAVVIVLWLSGMLMVDDGVADWWGGWFALLEEAHVYGVLARVSV